MKCLIRLRIHFEHIKNSNQNWSRPQVKIFTSKLIYDDKTKNDKRNLQNETHQYDVARVNFWQIETNRRRMMMSWLLKNLSNFAKSLKSCKTHLPSPKLSRISFWRALCKLVNWFWSCFCWSRISTLRFILS